MGVIAHRGPHIRGLEEGTGGRTTVTGPRGGPSGVQWVDRGRVAAEFGSSKGYFTPQQWTLTHIRSSPALSYTHRPQCRDVHVVVGFAARFLVGLLNFVWEILKTYPRPHKCTLSSHGLRFWPQGSPRTLHLHTDFTNITTYPAFAPDFNQHSLRTLHLHTNFTITTYPTLALDFADTHSIHYTYIRVLLSYQHLYYIFYILLLNFLFF